MDYINDFEVRVWDNDVFINGKSISYWGNQKCIGLQCNSEEDSDNYKSLAVHCEKIREEFTELNKLLKRIGE